MKYLLILLLCGLAGAETLQQKLDALSAAPNVLEARTVRGPASVPGFGNVYTAQVLWFYTEGGVAKKSSAEVIITSLGGIDPETGASVEAAYWLSEIPAPLRPVVVETYITGRTQPFTAMQVVAFCNTQWRATVGNAAALAIKEFSASNVDANTIRVTGLFHDVATNTRPRLTYLITLVDANGLTTGANVKFEKVVE